MDVVPARRRWWVWLALMLLLAGCHQVETSRPWFRATIRRRVEQFASVHELSELVEASLQREGLLDQSSRDPEAVVALLETRLSSVDGSRHLLAIAELSLRIGHQRRSQHPAEAMERFRDAAVTSASALRVVAPEPGEIELAITLHNRSLSALIPLVMAESTRSKRPWTEILTQVGLHPAGTSAFLAPDRFSRLELATSFRAIGLQVKFRNDGLGVPLVALRPVDRDHPTEPNERYFPRRLHVAATAVVVPPAGPLANDWRSRPIDFALFDPFTERSLAAGGRALTLATDRSTPLAVQVSQGKFEVIAMNGLFHAELAEKMAGLYMFRPYQPGKIPIVLVHGLFSTPEAWDQTINNLQNDPEIDARYQIWFFLYPTGNIVPQSAATLRHSLREAVATLDPGQSDPSLRRMVVIGHSMGGLLAKMMVQETGAQLWDSVVSIPPEKFEASAKTRELFSTSLIYSRLPFVERVVFIATPHRGSHWGDQFFARAIAYYIQPESDLKTASDELYRLYGKEVAVPEILRTRVSSIGNLAYKSPMLTAIDAVPLDPDVPFHSIIMQIPGTRTDGVVTYASSHYDGAASEFLVSGIHVDQEKKAVTDELKRILHLHLTAPGGP